MPLVTLLIRCKNEERYIGQTLGVLIGQRFRDFEVVAVDSGSHDNTINILRTYPVKLVQIKPKKFTFGYALNVGMDSAEGKYVCPISAHAVPKDDMWLKKLIEPLKDKKIAAAYGRQLPHSNCNPFERASLARWYGSDARIQTKDPFFSTVNAAIKKEIWKIFPFDETLPYAEDQKWAREVQKHGFAIAYQPSAEVYHSHSENLFKVYRRSLLEAVALSQMGVIKNQSFSNFFTQWRKDLIKDLQTLKETTSSKWWLFYAPLYRFAKTFGHYKGAKGLERKGCHLY